MRLKDCIAIGIFSICLACTDSGPSIDNADLNEVWRLANRGTGLIEQGKFEEAGTSWEELLALAPDWVTARINLGIASLNKEGGEEPAVGIFERVLEEDPDSPWAHFCLGLLLARKNMPERALEHYRAVLEVDPTDPDTHFRIGSLLRELGQDEQAVQALETALGHQPLLLGARYELSGALNALGREEEADRALEEFESLRASGRGIKRELIYGKMGFYARAIREFALPQPVIEPRKPAAVRFVDVSAELGLDAKEMRHRGPGTGEFSTWITGRSRAGSVSGGVSICDVDVDGDSDVLIANFGPGPEVVALINENGTLSQQSDELGLSKERARTVCIAAADFDGDSLPDLFLGRAEQDRILAREEEDFIGPFARTFDGVSELEEATYSCAVGDLDQDGDLDLVLGRHESLALFRWKGDGFERVQNDNTPNIMGPVLSVLVADIDGDGDLDITAGSPTVRAFASDRDWGFSEVGLPTAGTDPCASFRLGDVNGDGLSDWTLSSPASPTRLLIADQSEGFVSDPAWDLAAGRSRGTGTSLVDLDRDGDLDCLSIGSGLTYFRNDGADGWKGMQSELGLNIPRAELENVRGHALFDLEGDGDLDLIMVRNGGTPLLLRNETPPSGLLDWIGIVPEGVKSGEQARGKSLGVGARVEVTSGARTQIAYSRLGGSMCSIAPAVLHFQLTGEERADVRILWADGVIQNEMDLAGGQVHVIEQVDINASSCPLIFAWDGSRFRYETDCLGVGGIGFWIGPKLYGQPDPEEVVRIKGPMELRDGMFELRLAEPMEEATYLDEASLLRVLHPPGTAAYVDERFAFEEPLASGRPLLIIENERLFARDAVSRPLSSPETAAQYRPISFEEGRASESVQSAVEGGRRDTQALLTVDRVAAAPFAVHKRLLGYAEEWCTELEFDAGDLPDTDEPLFMFIDGWVEYPYSRLNLAAAQADLSIEPWSLEAPDGNGGWRVVSEQFGYPAGKPRNMAYEITPFLEDLRQGDSIRMRLRSNIEVFIDRIFLARDVSAREGWMQTSEVHPSSADMRFCGFPRTFAPNGAKPLEFDYAHRDRTSDFKTLAGRYSEFGDVLDLVQSRDDRFAIFGRGEEIALRFDPADFAPARQSSGAQLSERTFFMRVKGYCKDMCPQTAFPKTLEPLPFAAMESYPPPTPLGARHPSLRATSNTRVEPAARPVR